MSYCRFAWDGSDVYVFESSYGIECCGCALDGCTTQEPEEMILHLAQHRRAGHFVPERAILALCEDIPGAQRPRVAEPAGLLRGTLMLEIAKMQDRLAKLPVESEEELTTQPADAGDSN